MTKENMAIVLLDLQKEAVDEKGTFGKGRWFGDQGIAKEVARKDLLPKIRTLLDRARAANLTIMHVGTKYRAGYPELGKSHPVFDQVKATKTYLEDSWGVDFQEPIAPKGDEPIVWKHKVSAFYQTDLHLLLTSKGIETIVALGVALNNVVESTAREAADRGFQVIVLRDCCASFDGQQDDFAATSILPRFCRVMDSVEFMKEVGI